MNLCTCTGQQSAYPSSFAVMPFHNALEDCNADGHINSGNNPSTSDINQVGLQSSNPRFYENQLCRGVDQHLVSLTMFARGQHCID